MPAAPRQTAKIIDPSDEGLAQAALELAAGHPVAMPTETVYGLAAPAFDPVAVARIFDAKERPRFDPLIVHVSRKHWDGTLASLSSAHLIDLAAMRPEAQRLAESLLKAFWPGPFTLVLPKHAEVPDIVTSGLATVALRLPRHPVAQALIEATGSPLAAPSANRFGKVSPTTAQHVSQELGDRISLILDGGPCEVGLESTVLAIDSAANPVLLRPGGVSATQIEKVAGKPVLAAQSAVNEAAGTRPEAPGMLDSHYAPAKPLYVFERQAGAIALPRWLDKAYPTGTRVALLLQTPLAPAKVSALVAETGWKIETRVLSREGDPVEAARGLFGAMRELDGSEATFILAERALVDEGLGHAINDRLERASSNKQLVAPTSIPGSMKEIEVNEVASFVSHDLRNPLSVVLAYADLLSRGAQAGQFDARTVKQINGVRRAAERIDFMIQNISDLVKLETGRLILDSSDENFGEALSQAIESVRYLIVEKSLVLERDTAAVEKLQVHVDRRRLVHALQSVLHNAAKFTPEHGTIRLTGEATDDRLFFRVADSGPGITDEQRSQVFECSWRAPAAKRFHAGMSLYVSRSTIEAQGGRITLERGDASRPTGAIFTIDLPLAATHLS